VPDQPPTEPREAAPRRPPRTPNRYELPWTSMVGALAVVIAVVAAFVVWRAVNRDNSVEPTPTVDYQSWLKAARSDGRLVGVAPTALPRGWRPTSARYDSGVSPHWHLGLLTAHRQYVGLEEGLDPLDDQVHRFVDDNASRGRDVVLDGVKWQTWTDSGGDYAVVRQQPAPKGDVQETVLVVGSASPAEVRSLAESLVAPQRQS
jgi:uncharacterized protein DUF4245